MGCKGMAPHPSIFNIFNIFDIFAQPSQNPGRLKPPLPARWGVRASRGEAELANRMPFHSSDGVVPAQGIAASNAAAARNTVGSSRQCPTI